MQKTLLRIVQDILYDMDSDEINSIGDSIESIQVARKVENIFWDIVTRLQLPKKSALYKLLHSGDTDEKTILYLPRNATTLDNLSFDTGDGVKELFYVDFEDFMAGQRSKITDVSTVTPFTITTDNGQFTFYPDNDRPPEYYTSFNDNIVILDAYDSTLWTTIVADKTIARGFVLPTFEQDDDFIPDLEPEIFTMFFLEAKQACFADMKQVQNGDNGQRIRKHWIHSQISKDAIQDPFKNTRDLPNYGRRRGQTSLRAGRNSW